MISALPFQQGLVQGNLSIGLPMPPRGAITTFALRMLATCALDKSNTDDFAWRACRARVLFPGHAVERLFNLSDQSVAVRRLQILAWKSVRRDGTHYPTSGQGWGDRRDP